MKKYNILKNILFVLLLCTANFCMYSCKMDSTCEFYVEKMDDISAQEYFESEQIEFAKINNIVITPYIMEINYEECESFIYAYSMTGLEDVKIKNVCMIETDSEDVIFDKEVAESIMFEKTEEQVYRGYIDVSVFPKEGLELSDGKKFTLEVEAEVSNEDVTTEKTICFDILIKRYKSHVTIT